MAKYIEREAAMLTPVLPKEYRQYQTDNLDDAYEQGWEDALNNLKNAPAADVAPVVHGRWEETDLVELQGTISETMRIPNMGLRCTACAHVFDKRLLWKDNYCPNCGAKMNGGTNEPV